MKKRFLALALSVAVAAGCVACGGGADKIGRASCRERV